MSDVDAPDAAIRQVAHEISPTSKIESWATRDSYSCVIVVVTDEEKQRINSNADLLGRMKAAAAEAGRAPDYLTAESQETVDRRWGGDWNYVFR